MRRSMTVFALCLVTSIAVPCSTAGAQSVAGTSCSTYRDNSDATQQALYMAYLQGFANASTPDPRYTQSDAALADDAKKVKDWCGKNSRSTFADAVYAVLGSAIKNAAAAQGPPQYQEPTSCRVGPTNQCSGCSVTCSGGKQAVCKQGTDNLDNNRCVFQSDCHCK